MKGYELTKNHFNIVKNVEWRDVISKLNIEFKENTSKFLFDKDNPLKYPPTFVLHSKFYPNSIFSAYKEVNSKVSVKDMHIYLSLGEHSKTFGRHKDTMDVLIVQSIGNVSYLFDDEVVIDLFPGDSLYIKSGFYHCPIIKEPRVTLSFGL